MAIINNSGIKMTILAFNQVQFLTSIAELKQLPPEQGREIAFAGRSNAGKSSGLNAITGIKGLARSSKTPGRTQLINLFALDGEKRLVDLPGYGYAKVPETIKRRWQQTLGEYLQQRECLTGLMLFMDIRHPLKDLDVQMIEWAIFNQLTVHVLLTKADKLSRGAAAAILQQVKKQLSAYGNTVSVQLFSALKQQGVDEARAKLAEWFNLEESSC